jgi:hypothetical protein
VAIASAGASSSTLQWLQRNQEKFTTAARLLRSNNLAGHELRVGVGEVGHVAHDGVHGGLVLGGLLEVGHAAPLEGGLDAVGSVVSELEDLCCVSERPRYEEIAWSCTFQDLRPEGPHFSWTRGM